MQTVLFSPRMLISIAFTGLVVLAAFLYRKVVQLESTVATQQKSESKAKFEAETWKKKLAEADKKRAEADEDNEILLSILQATKEPNRTPAQSSDAKLRVPALLDRLNSGRGLAKIGHHEEALAAFLFCFDDGAQVASFKGGRLSAVLIEISALADSYPPARMALIERREAAKQAALADARDLDALADFAALNRALKEDFVTIAMLDSLPSSDSRRRILASASYNTLVDQRRYEDALQGVDLDIMNRSFDGIVSHIRTSDPAVRETLQDQAIDHTAKHVEMLLGAGRTAQAEALANKVLMLDASDRTKQRLVVAAGRAGSPTALNKILRPIQ